MQVPDIRSSPKSDVSLEHDPRRQFEVVCAPLSADLFRFVFWLCHDRSLAEDVVQETLLRAWRSFESLQDRTAVKPWLFTIARRELARAFERKRLDTVEIDTLADTDEEALAAESLDVDLHDVEDMRRAIVQLEPGLREPLVLQVLLGYSTEEIANHMQLSLSAVLSRLFRARRLIRRRMLGVPAGS